MSFDTDTRNRLAKFVASCRKLLCGDYQSPGGEMVRQLAHFGIQANGDTLDLDSLTHLSEHEREQAQTLRDILDHKRANSPATKTWKKFDPTVYDLIQEQGFTALNRLCALRMAEERKILAYPCLSKGHQSDAFQLYEMRAGKNVDSVGPEERYQLFLFSLFDELSLDLGALFDRRNPQGLLFPAPAALAELLEEINNPDLRHLWAEDETIGWIYQYWNSKEERKAMRDASAAPRNSRELAVRNQFFTPRYVVEFLTDNTLGRIWYEMTKGQTRLAEQCRYLVRRPTEIFLGEGEDAPEPPEGDTEETLSQEELLKQPVHTPHRPVKDPREIRLLDPACGSMHFGLYAFDLFEAIYEEVWDKGLCPALQEAYPEKADYLRDVPRLIIEHNIHGVDIDPRAVQIAGLSLWLRAQKTWKDTPAAERPRVRRSNIVCAEPMPGSDAMLEDFLQTLDPPLLGELVKTVFDKMQLAGEAGTLLKIEEEIRTAIDDAKAKWEKLGAAERDLFSAEELNQTLRPGAQQELTGVEKALATDHRPLATDFFDTAEERIYAALRDYAESAEAGDYQRRLFAEDAAHGFAFIDLCRKRYEAVVMNPPFGEPAKISKKYIEAKYPSSSGDILQSFLDRGLHSLEPRGRSGVISSRTGFFLGNSQNWRRNVIFVNRLVCFADLGLGVLDDALVEVASYVIEKSEATGAEVFTDRQLDTRSKDSGLLAAITGTATNRNDRLGLFDQSLLQLVPDYTFAYWAPASFLQRYAEEGQFHEAIGKVRQGVATAADFRFARLGWEVHNTTIGVSHRWQRFSKGGEYSPTFDDIHLLVDWENDGHQLRAFPGCFIRNDSYYFRPGATYSVRTASAFTAKVLPADCIFSHMAQSWFLDDLDRTMLTIGFMSCRVPQAFIELGVGGGDIATSGSAARRYTTAVVEGVPSGVLDEIDTPQNLNAVLNLYRFRSSRFSSNETSCLFSSFHIAHSAPSIEQAANASLRESLRQTVSALRDSFQLDNAVTEAFDLSEEEKRFVAEEVGVHPCEYAGTTPAEETTELFGLSDENLIAHATSRHGSKRWFTKKSYFVDRKLEVLCHILRIPPDLAESSLEQISVPEHIDSHTRSFLSELLGCALGRWDIRYATGERQPPELPDPFDPLPVCPPGMLQNADGLPMEKDEGRSLKDEGKYPLQVTWEGILVDDENHPEDIVTRVRDALAVIWGDRSAAIEQEACEILGVRTLRDYFAEKKSGGKFFKDHLSRYSKSRRQAPIYWPLSTESGTYTLWIYYHRLTEDTLYACITNFVAPKQEQAEKTLARLAAKGDARTKAEDKEYEQTEALIGELATFRAELERLAKIWKPNLNDGVQITAAPLWSLFRLKPWQKKLKDTWQKLEAGDYDWSHLAHTLWPERVIPKCATDRSLAIAHGYEADLWEEVTDAKGKLVWQPKKSADETVQKLINNA